MSGFIFLIFFKLHAPVDFHPKVVFQALYLSQFAENNSLSMGKISHTFPTLCQFSRLSHP
jgi:hypothetical protein